MDQNNPLAGLTHKRRLSALGRAVCPVTVQAWKFETSTPRTTVVCAPLKPPEGPNIGLIGSLATYGRINSFGFIEDPLPRGD